MQILHHLQQLGAPAGVEDVAGAVGLHPNTARENLDRLVAAQFVAKASEYRNARGRPRILYRAVPRPAAATLDARLREVLLTVLAEGHGSPGETGAGADPSASEDVEAVGGQGGRSVAHGQATERTHQLAALEAHLEDVGFDPEVEPDAARVHLWRCPFQDLATERTELVCSVHLKIVRDVMELEGGPLTAERLEPFVGPQHCLLHLRPR